jgi:hypothetical protein
MTQTERSRLVAAIESAEARRRQLVALMSTPPGPLKRAGRMDNQSVAIFGRRI